MTNEKPKIKFNVEERDTISIVHFECGIVEPADLKDLVTPFVDCKKGVVLSGRGPIWLYGFLIHQYHPAIWVGCFDPRLGGAVVVMNHVVSPDVGDIVLVDISQPKAKPVQYIKLPVARCDLCGTPLDQNDICQKCWKDETNPERSLKSE